MSGDVQTVREALGLARSIALAREPFSPEAEAKVEAALAALDRLAAAETRCATLDAMLRETIGACAPPIEALASVHADGKWIAPDTLTALKEAVAVLRRNAAALAGVAEPPAEEPDDRSSFQRVTDEATGGCGCACHTGVGYRTSCEHCRMTAA